VTRQVPEARFRGDDRPAVGDAALLANLPRTTIGAMVDAALLGLLAASSLVLGAVVAFTVDIPARGLGLIMAFGAGVLMSAVAYELVADALGDEPWLSLFVLAFAAGAAVFYVGSLLLDHMTVRGASRREQRRQAPASSAEQAQGAAIVLGAVLDGIPESVVLGVSLIDGGAFSVPMLLAVFISNVPEALGASADLARGGVARARILALWATVAVASAAAAGIGYGVFSLAPDEWVAAVQMFAGGAIIAMLAESMVPEAYEKAGRAVGLATAVGFAASAILSAA
jgi:zinc transporter, ZIP family